MKNRVWGINVIGAQGINVDDDVVIGSNDEGTKVLLKVGGALISEDKFKELEDGDLGTKVVANPEGEADDSLSKVQIGSMIYEIEGGGGSSTGEGFLTANNEVEAEALCKEENLGKYVKYVGLPISVATTQTEKPVYKANFDSEVFLNKIDHQDVNYNFVYNGTQWKHGTDDVNLSEYGVSLYNGTPESLPPIGSSMNGLFFDTSIMPTKEDIDALASYDFILKGYVSYYHGMIITIKAGYCGEDGDVYGIYAGLEEGGEIVDAFPIYCAFNDEPDVFDWVPDALEEIGMMFSSAYGTQLYATNTDAYALCNDYISAYEFPHAPYIPEAELPKLAGDVVNVNNTLIHPEWVTLNDPSKYTGADIIYIKHIDGFEDVLNSLTYTEYDWSDGDAVAPIYKYHISASFDGEVQEADIYRALQYDASDQKLFILDYGVQDGSPMGQMGDQTFYLEDVPVGAVDPSYFAFSENLSYIAASGELVVTIVEDYDSDNTIKSFMSFSQAFGDEALDDPKISLSFASRFTTSVDASVLYEATKDLNQNELQFVYDGENWIPNFNYENADPITTDDIDTSLEHVYFNIYGNIVPTNSAIIYCAREWGSPQEYGFRYVDDITPGHFVWMLPNNNSNMDVTWCSEEVHALYYGVIPIDWAKGFNTKLFGSDGLLLNNRTVDGNSEDGLIHIADLGEEAVLNNMLSKSPFVYDLTSTSEMASKYGITVLGTPAVGSMITIVCEPSAYEQYRLYTVKRISNENNFGYELVETYATPDQLKDKLADKQDKLTAGKGINIATGLLSSSVESGDSSVVYFNKDITYSDMEKIFGDAPDYQDIEFATFNGVSGNYQTYFKAEKYPDRYYISYMRTSGGGGSGSSVFYIYPNGRTEWSDVVGPNGMFDLRYNASSGNYVFVNGGSVPVDSWDCSLMGLSPFSEQTQISANMPYIPQCSDINGNSINLKFVKCTQSEYDAISSKDNSTLYVIIG